VVAPALGILELNSIARGMVVADAMVKRAPIRLLEAHPISPGKYLILVAGQVADVDESLAAGTAAAQSTVVDRLFLPQAHADLIPAITGTAEPAPLEAIGIVETFTVASTVLAADAAAKTAEVRLGEMRLANGLGGKAFYWMTGALDQVEAAVAAGISVLASGLLLASEIIPAPHDDFTRKLGA
jgi:microcompartment protein CcmL/EutN